jgi:hypothetical protein
MFSTRLLGLIISTAALAAVAAPAGAATPPAACPSRDLTMPGSSTWGNFTSHVRPGSDGCL